MEGIVTSSVQCWGCPVFDRLFYIVSTAAAAVYSKITVLCIILFLVLLTFVVLNMVWQNIKNNVSDPMYKNSLQPLLINSLIAMALLGTGVLLPRFISQITFEPTAQIALTYTQALTHNTAASVDYQPIQIPDNGFFRPQLRDTIIMIMKTTVSQFQAYIKLGLAIMDTAFSLKAFLGIGALVKHFALLIMGFYLAYGFFKLFINFCFYFVDIIVAMMFFAFFFPLGIIMNVFKGNGVPAWVSKIGSGIGASQIKQLINAIISLAAAVITYTVIIVIIAKFFTQTGSNPTELVNMITTGEIFNADLAEDNLEMLTVTGCIVLLYIINFLQTKIPEVAKMILSTFGVQEEKGLSEEMAKSVMAYAKNRFNEITNIGKKIISGGDSAGGSTP